MFYIVAELGKDTPAPAGQNWIPVSHSIVVNSSCRKTELCKRLFAHCTATALGSCSIRGHKLWGTEIGQASYIAHKAGTLQHSSPCTVSSGLACDQENGVQWDPTAPHMEQTPVYFSHFICTYIHYILILQVVKAIILK